MQRSNLPILGISMGDPGGVGPEVAAKALVQKDIYDSVQPLVVGDFRVMEDVLRFADVKVGLNPIQKVADARFEHGTLDILDLNNMPMDRLRYGEVTREQGNASFECVTKNIELAMNGEIDGTVTGPINKAAVHAAGHQFAGHTEIYAALTDTRNYCMMLTHRNFRVTHVSTHVSLREACDRVKKDRIIRVIDLTFGALKKLGVSDPKIAVAGLNPHCGEGGLFGHEDDDEIRPAVEHSAGEGKFVDGPVPADTVFSKMRGAMYDAVVVMYHDQGHIPTKLIGFQYDEEAGQWGEVSGVNVTLGLPIVRTSVDHGTAFDLAGKGRANPQSMIEAIKMAALLSKKT
jgi:4-hydroxythreonine-4-phosphate dehydrogenase